MKLLRESPVGFLESISNPPETLYIEEVPGPVFSIFLAGTEEGLCFSTWRGPIEEFSHDIDLEWGVRCVHDPSPLKRFIDGFKAYFDGERGPMSMTVQPIKASPFVITVHKALTKIPFGGALSYGDVAEFIGKPTAARAVGNACGRNRTLIVIPCHRVLAANGIGGFGAGIHIKKKLLEFENINW